MENQYPEGWDEDRVREVIDHYESQSDEEAAAEYEAAIRRQESEREGDE